jgi:hypothetical protein
MLPPHATIPTSSAPASKVESPELRTTCRAPLLSLRLPPTVHAPSAPLSVSLASLLGGGQCPTTSNKSCMPARQTRPVQRGPRRGFRRGPRRGSLTTASPTKTLLLSRLLIPRRRGHHQGGYRPELLVERVQQAMPPVPRIGEMVCMERVMAACRAGCRIRRAVALLGPGVNSRAGRVGQMTRRSAMAPTESGNGNQRVTPLDKTMCALRSCLACPSVLWLHAARRCTDRRGTERDWSTEDLGLSWPRYCCNCCATCTRKTLCYVCLFSCY